MCLCRLVCATVFLQCLKCSRGNVLKKCRLCPFRRVTSVLAVWLSYLGCVGSSSLCVCVMLCTTLAVEFKLVVVMCGLSPEIRLSVVLCACLHVLVVFLIIELGSCLSTCLDVLFKDLLSCSETLACSVLSRVDRCC